MVLRSKFTIKEFPAVGRYSAKSASWTETSQSTAAPPEAAPAAARIRPVAPSRTSTGMGCAHLNKLVQSQQSLILEQPVPKACRNLPLTMPSHAVGFPPPLKKLQSHN